MKIGIFGTLTDSGIRIDELAKAAEDRGFESLWIGEHTHVPASVTTHARENDAPLPEFYKRLPDPFVQLGAAAAVTKNLRLGTSVCIVPEHDPIILAKRVSTLDYISDGRFIFGVGYGWNAAELKNHGVEHKKRRSVFKEKLLAMRAFWEQEVAEYKGEYVNFDPSYQWPKPTQKPLPVLIGAEAGPMTINDIVKYSNGWLPMAFRGGDVRLPVQFENLKKAMDEAGRPISELDLSLMDPMYAFEDYTPEDYANHLKSLKALPLAEEHGFGRVVVGIPFFDRDRALKHLDAAAAHYFS